MEEETKDQVPEETETKEEIVEEPKEEQSTEPEKEPITLDKTYELATALQKGYTLTRQDMAEIKRNQEAIQEALTAMGKKDDFGDDEPLTIKSLLRLQDEQRQKQEKEQQRVNGIIESQVNELRAQGIVHSKQDEDDLMTFAVKHKITDLLKAADIWSELQEAKKVGGKVLAEAKNRVKQEAGSQVGTSQKTTVAEQGIDYEEIRRKDWGELTR